LTQVQPMKWFGLAVRDRLRICRAQRGPKNATTARLGSDYVQEEL
jgi:hypothetical protein